jgi:hypothetical protein
MGKSNKVKLLAKLTDKWDHQLNGDKIFYGIWKNKPIVVNYDEDADEIFFMGNVLKDSKRLRNGSSMTHSMGLWFQLLDINEIVRHKLYGKNNK